MNPDLVLEFSYRSAQVRLIAHRWNTDAPFSLIIWKKDLPHPACCQAGEGFSKVLKAFTSLKLRRTLDVGQTEEYFQKNPLPSWAEVMIRDNSALEPFRALIMPAPGSAGEAVVHFHGATYLVDLDAQVLNLMADGCKALGVPDAPPRRR